MINEQPVAERVNFGLKKEDAIVKCLETHYGFNFEDVTLQEDTNEKIDRYITKMFDTVPPKRLKTQIKARVSGDDILYDLYEPWHGIKDKRTRPGRDDRKPLDIYICLSKDGKKIRIIKGAYLRQVAKDVREEWASKKYRIADGIPFFPEVYSQEVQGATVGCELRFHYDAHSHTPKVLLFIPDYIIGSRYMTTVSTKEG